MTLTPRFSLSLIASSLISLSASFYAQADVEELSKIYTGLSLSAVSYDSNAYEDDDDVEYEFVDYRSDIDTDDMGFKAFAGYQVFENFALEAAYMDAGGISLSSSESSYEDGEGYAVNVNGAINLSGVSVSAVGRWAVNDDFHVFAKAGLLNWDIDAKSTVTVEAHIPSLGISNFSKQESGGIKFDGTDIIYSAGLSYSFDDFTVYGEYEVIDLTIKASEQSAFVEDDDADLEEAEDGNLDATSLNIGLIYRF